MANSKRFDLVDRGPSYRLGLHLGFGHPDRPRRLRKVLLLILVTWVPLLILSLAAGHAFGGRVAVPLLHDPVIYSRFLFVVPLLAVVDFVVGRGVCGLLRGFLQSGILPGRGRAPFVAAP